MMPELSLNKILVKKSCACNWRFNNTGYLAFESKVSKLCHQSKYIEENILFHP